MVRAEKISHVGIAVSNLEEAIKSFSNILEVSSVEREDVPTEGIRVAFLRVGDSEIELLSPTGETGSIAKFLKDRGPGLHHVAVKVPNVAEAIKDAKSKGFNVIDSVPRRAARGAQAAFVHPKSLQGVLLEFYNT